MGTGRREMKHLFYFMALLATLSGPAIPSALLVEFHMAGGIGGMERRLSITEDGLLRIIISTGKVPRKTCSLRLNREELKDIDRLLKTADIPDLKESYLPEHPFYDGYTYEIVYRGHSVRTQDPLKDTVPTPLLNLIDRLRRILTETLESGCGKR